MTTIEESEQQVAEARRQYDEEQRKTNEQQQQTQAYGRRIQQPNTVNKYSGIVGMQQRQNAVRTSNVLLGQIAQHQEELKQFESRQLAPAEKQIATYREEQRKYEYARRIAESKGFDVSVFGNQGYKEVQNEQAYQKKLEDTASGLGISVAELQKRIADQSAKLQPFGLKEVPTTSGFTYESNSKRQSIPNPDLLFTANFSNPSTQYLNAPQQQNVISFQPSTSISRKDLMSVPSSLPFPVNNIINPPNRLPANLQPPSQFDAYRQNFVSNVENSFLTSSPVRISTIKKQNEAGNKLFPFITGNVNGVNEAQLITDEAKDYYALQEKYDDLSKQKYLSPEQYNSKLNKLNIEQQDFVTIPQLIQIAGNERKENPYYTGAIQAVNTGGKSIVYLAPVGGQALGYLQGGNQVVSGFQDVSKGNTKQGLYELGQGALFLGLASKFGQRVTATKEAEQLGSFIPPKISAVYSLAKPLALPTTFGTLSGMENYQQTRSIPSAIGAGIGSGLPFAANDFYRSQSTKRAEFLFQIKQPALTNDMKSTGQVNMGNNVLDLPSRKGGIEPTAYGTIRGREYSSSQGFQQGYLTEFQKNLHTLSNGRYIPKPILTSMPEGGKILVRSFDSKGNPIQKDFNYSPKQIQSNYNRMKNYYTDVIGLSDNQASRALRTVKPKLYERNINGDVVASLSTQRPMQMEIKFNQTNKPLLEVVRTSAENKKLGMAIEMDVRTGGKTSSENYVEQLYSKEIRQPNTLTMKQAVSQYPEKSVLYYGTRFKPKVSLRKKSIYEQSQTGLGNVEELSLKPIMQVSYLVTPSESMTVGKSAEGKTLFKYNKRGEKGNPNIEVSQGNVEDTSLKVSMKKGSQASVITPIIKSKSGELYAGKDVYLANSDVGFYGAQPYKVIRQFKSPSTGFGINEMLPPVEAKGYALQRGKETTAAPLTASGEPSLDSYNLVAAQQMPFAKVPEMQFNAFKEVPSRKIKSITTIDKTGAVVRNKTPLQPETANKLKEQLGLPVDSLIASKKTKLSDMVASPQTKPSIAKVEFKPSSTGGESGGESPIQTKSISNLDFSSIPVPVQYPKEFQGLSKVNTPTINSFSPTFAPSINSETVTRPTIFMGNRPSIELKNNAEVKSNLKNNINLELNNKIQPNLNIQPIVNLQPKVETKPNLEIKTNLNPAITLEPRIELQPQVELQPQLQLQPKVFVQPKIQTKPFLALGAGKGSSLKSAVGKLSKGYKTFVYKNKKKVYEPGIRTEAQAVKLGEGIVLKTVAARFGIESSGTLVKSSESEYTPSAKVFRNYLIKSGRKVPIKNEWVQLAGTRNEFTVPRARLSARSEVSSLLSFKKGRSVLFA